MKRQNRLPVTHKLREGDSVVETTSEGDLLVARSKGGHIIKYVDIGADGSQTPVQVVKLKGKSFIIRTESDGRDEVCYRCHVYKKVGMV